MAVFYGINSDSVSTLFSGLNASSGIGSSNILSEYYSIKSGAYKKALSAYYAKMDTESSSASDKKNNIKDTLSSTATSTDSIKTLTNIKDSSDTLKKTAGQLVTKGSDSVFKKSKDDVYSKVNEFVDNYNKLISDANEATSSNIKNTLSNLKNYTSSSKKMLDKVGISINENGKLSLDKEKFMSADISDIKNVFNGTGSYAYYVQSKSAMISYHAENEAAKGNTYTSSGGYSYNYSTGEIVNNFI